jgi:hypothetical protein
MKHTDITRGVFQLHIFVYHPPTRQNLLSSMQVRVALRCLSGGHLLEQHALCRLSVWRHCAAKGGSLVAVPGARWNGRVDSHKGVEARRRETEASKWRRGTWRWLAMGCWRALAAENDILGGTTKDSQDVDGRWARWNQSASSQAVAGCFDISSKTHCLPSQEVVHECK